MRVKILMFQKIFSKPVETIGATGILSVKGLAKEPAT